MHDVPPAFKIRLIGNFPPRLCGIATFTKDVFDSLAAFPDCEIDVAAMDDGFGQSYSAPVDSIIPQNDPEAYCRLGQQIAQEADVILLQHEFGIFGGAAGDLLLNALSGHDVPLVTTLHTVLDAPNPDQDRVLRAICARSSRLIVMSVRSADILERIYAVPTEKIRVIAHGVPDRAIVTSSVARQHIGLAERPTLLTFGLLSPNKGLETMIEAMPAIRAGQPDVQYIILGATHPHLVRHEGGEVYRSGLQKRVRELDLQDTVIFEDRFVELDELCNWLTAADVYVTPYPNVEQSTSGTLAYAYGLARAIISTPYWHAAELLAHQPKQLVPFRDSGAMASAILNLLDNAEARQAAERDAWKRSRPYTWPRVGAQYLHLLRKVHRQQGLSNGPGTTSSIDIVASSLSAMRYRLADHSAASLAG
ncbi:glycosyltransferase family 4 protein [Pacificimonas sp. ICDLI1SI03]